MKAIGGYFELELRKGKPYHAGLMKLNTGRNALEYCLKYRNIQKVFLPFYSCQSLLEPINKLNLSYEYYALNEQLEPIFQLETMADNEALLLINYFGLKDDFIQSFTSQINTHVIIDNTQAFYTTPHTNLDTIYSLRKFFGLPDGAYLSTTMPSMNFDRDYSLHRMSHLLGRIESDAEDFYKDYSVNNQSLSQQPIYQMSNLTEALSRNIDYKKIQKIRYDNYIFLQKELGLWNEHEWDISACACPMVYPFQTRSADSLKAHLASNRIYTATYWPEVLLKQDVPSFERMLVSDTVFLPIDQRIGKKERAFMVKQIKTWKSNYGN